MDVMRGDDERDQEMLLKSEKGAKIASLSLACHADGLVHGC